MYEENIYRQTYENALQENQKSIDNWTKHKKDFEQLKENLQLYPKRLKHKVLVPIGKKALIRGNLIHTNEVLINLGCETFVKRSVHGAVEVCDRIINRSSEQINDYKKERQLLSRNMAAIFDNNIFNYTGSQVDLMEQYDENVEKEWRASRSERVKKHNVDENLKRKEISHESIMERLNVLEMAEDLEEDLNLNDDEVDYDSLTSSEEYDEEEYVYYDNEKLNQIEYLLTKGEDKFVNEGITTEVSASELETELDVGHKCSSEIEEGEKIEIDTVVINEGDADRKTKDESVTEQSDRKSASINEEGNRSEETNSREVKSPPSKRVSFSEGLLLFEDDVNKSSKGALDDSVPVIYFKHHHEVDDEKDESDRNEVDTSSNEFSSANKTINSPSDVMKMFAVISPTTENNKQVKSILKKKTSNHERAFANEEFDESADLKQRTRENQKKYADMKLRMKAQLRNPNENIPSLLPSPISENIVLRDAGNLSIVQNTTDRPVSRFKASRS